MVGRGPAPTTGEPALHMIPFRALPPSAEVGRVSAASCWRAGARRLRGCYVWIRRAGIRDPVLHTPRLGRVGGCSWPWDGDGSHAWERVGVQQGVGELVYQISERGRTGSMSRTAVGPGA